MGEYREQAALYRAALLLGLVRGAEVVRWADRMLGEDDATLVAFADLVSTPPGLVQRDLASGRRSLQDTMTVLKQLRAFVKVGPDLNERIKALGVDVALAQAGGEEKRMAAEQRVRDWLRQYE